MKKRVLSIALCIAMLLTLVPTALADALPTFSASKETAAPGEDVTVSFDVANNTGLAGVRLLVSYSSDALEIKSVAKDADLKISETPANIKNGFVLSYGDVEENCSFDALIEASKETLQDKIGQMLFG